MKMTLVSTVTGCISTSTIASLLGISIGMAISVIWLKNCVITAGIPK